MSKNYKKPDFNEARNKLAKLLKEKRDELGMTQIEFCEYLENFGLEVSYGFLQAWERPDAKGKRRSTDTSLPGLVNFKGLSELFGYRTIDVFYNHLIGLNDPKSELTYEDIERKASELNRDEKFRLMTKLQDQLINN